MLLTQASKHILVASLLGLMMSVSVAHAEGKRKGPPPEEAIATCANQTEGQACSFSTPNGDAVEGSCKAPPRGREGALACRPERGSGGRPPRGE